MEITSEKVYCPLMMKDIETGYCWELCNIATDEILLDGDSVKDWSEAQHVCVDVCGLFNN